jgi:signal transduction histidine kinase
VKKSSKNNLHNRITAMLLAVGIVSTILYLALIVTVVNKMEDTMLATLIGHEAEELITELAQDSTVRMPKTDSVNAYLLSRDNLDPIPDYLRGLAPNVYNRVSVGEQTYQFTIIDFNDDRLYLSFETTDISRLRMTLLVLLVAGGVLSTIVMVISGFWLFKKYLLPVSHLAAELADLKPDDRKIRLEDKYEGYEVGTIARSFDEFMQRMDDFVEREQSFTTAVSHELRTPVSVISTATDLLELRGITKKQESAVRRIKSATRYMAQVIETLLYFARNTKETIDKTLSETSLHEVFSDVMKTYEAHAADRKLTLKYKCKSRIKARISENHLEIILGNLIRNAIDNTDEGEVKVTLHENGFSVADTGYGIEANEINEIFKLNYHSPDSQGCGLGLYLVKNICDIYGLKLEIKSTVGKGSEFFVLIPENVVSQVFRISTS